jgi:hypothetical protein
LEGAFLFPVAAAGTAGDAFEFAFVFGLALELDFIRFVADPGAAGLAVAAAEEVCFRFF